MALAFVACLVAYSDMEPPDDSCSCCNMQSMVRGVSDDLNIIPLAAVAGRATATNRARY